MQDQLQAEIEKLVAKFGQEKVSSALRRTAESDIARTGCTILVNRGVHHFPDYLFRFDQTFIVYEGSANLESEDEFRVFVSERLTELAKHLKKQKWTEIDIIISGHSSICMQVKMLVYRITHIDTTDWVFNGKGKYFAMNLPFRSLVASAGA